MARRKTEDQVITVSMQLNTKGFSDGLTLSNTQAKAMGKNIANALTIDPKSATSALATIGKEKDKLIENFKKLKSAIQDSLGISPAQARAATDKLKEINTQLKGIADNAKKAADAMKNVKFQIGQTNKNINSVITRLQKLEEAAKRIGTITIGVNYVQQGGAARPRGGSGTVVEDYSKRNEPTVGGQQLKYGPMAMAPHELDKAWAAAGPRITKTIQTSQEEIVKSSEKTVKAIKASIDTLSKDISFYQKKAQENASKMALAAQKSRDTATRKAQEAAVKRDAEMYAAQGLKVLQSLDASRTLSERREQLAAQNTARRTKEREAAVYQSYATERTEAAKNIQAIRSAEQQKAAIQTQSLKSVEKERRKELAKTAAQVNAGPRVSGNKSVYTAFALTAADPYSKAFHQRISQATPLSTTPSLAPLSARVAPTGSRNASNSLINTVFSQGGVAAAKAFTGTLSALGTVATKTSGSVSKLGTAFSILPRVVGKNTAASAASLSDFDRRVIESTDNTRNRFSRLFSANFFADMAYGAFSGMINTLQSLSVETVKYAARTQELGVVLASIGRVNNISAQTLQEQEVAIKRLNITTQDARETLARFVNVGFDVNQAAPLARVAQDLAVISGLNTSEELDKLVVAIQTLQSRNLRAAGAFFTVDEVLDRLAGTTGRARDSFSTLEKQQAVLNYTLQYGEKVTGSYEAAMSTASKQLRSLDRYFKEAQNSLGEGFVPALGAAVTVAEEFLKTASSYPETFMGIAKTIGVVTLAVVALRTELVKTAAIEVGKGLTGLKDIARSVAGKPTSKQLLAAEGIRQLDLEKDSLRTALKRDVNRKLALKDELALTAEKRKQRDLQLQIDALDNKNRGRLREMKGLDAQKEAITTPALSSRVAGAAGGVGLAIAGFVGVMEAVAAYREIVNAPLETKAIDLSASRKYAQDLKNLTDEQTRSTKLLSTLSKARLDNEIAISREKGVQLDLEAAAAKYYQADTEALQKVIEGQGTLASSNLKNTFTNLEAETKRYESLAASAERLAEATKNIDPSSISGFGKFMGYIDNSVLGTISEKFLGTEGYYEMFSKTAGTTDAGRLQAQSTIVGALDESTQKLDGYKAGLKASAKEFIEFSRIHNIPIDQLIQKNFGKTPELMEKVRKAIAEVAEEMDKVRKSLGLVGVGSERELGRSTVGVLGAFAKEMEDRGKQARAEIEKQNKDAQLFGTGQEIVDVESYVREQQAMAARAFLQSQAGNETISGFKKSIASRLSFLKQGGTQITDGVIRDTINNLESTYIEQGITRKSGESQEDFTKRIEEARTTLRSFLDNFKSAKDADEWESRIESVMSNVKTKVEEAKDALDDFFKYTTADQIQGSQLNTLTSGFNTLISNAARLGTAPEKVKTMIDSLNAEFEADPKGTLDALREAIRLDERRIKIEEGILGYKRQQEDVEDEIAILKETSTLPAIQSELLLQKSILQTVQDRKQAEQQLTADIAAEIDKRTRYSLDSIKEQNRLAAEVFLDMQRGERTAQEDALKAEYRLALERGDDSAFRDNPVLQEAIKQAEALAEIDKKGGEQVIKIEETNNILRDTRNDILAGNTAIADVKTEATKNTDAIVAAIKEINLRGSDTGLVASAGGSIQLGSFAGTSTNQSKAAALNKAASMLGVSPLALATVIGYETGGSYSPAQKGPTTKWGQHFGLIQFGQPQAKAFNASPNQSFEDQLLNSVVPYLRKNFVNKGGKGDLGLYASIIGGSPTATDVSDGYTTARQAVNSARFRQHSEKAKRLFGFKAAIPSTSTTIAAMMVDPSKAPQGTDAASIPESNARRRFAEFRLSNELLEEELLLRKKIDNPEETRLRNRQESERRAGLEREYQIVFGLSDKQDEINRATEKLLRLRSGDRTDVGLIVEDKRLKRLQEQLETEKQIVELSEERTYRILEIEEYRNEQRKKFNNEQLTQTFAIQDANEQLYLREQAYLDENSELRQNILDEETKARREAVQAQKEQIDALERYNSTYLLTEENRTRISKDSYAERMEAYRDLVEGMMKLDADYGHANDNITLELANRQKELRNAQEREYSDTLLRQLELENEYRRKSDDYDADTFRNIALEKINGSMKDSTTLMGDLFSDAFDGISEGFGGLVDKMTSRMGIFGNAAGNLLKGVFNNIFGTITKNILDDSAPTNDKVTDALAGVGSVPDSLAKLGSAAADSYNAQMAYSNGFVNATQGLTANIHNFAGSVAQAYTTMISLTEIVMEAVRGITSAAGTGGGTVTGGGAGTSPIGGMASAAIARMSQQAGGLGKIPNATDVGGTISAGDISIGTSITTRALEALPTAPGVGGVAQGVGTKAARQLLEGISLKKIGTQLLMGAPMIGAGLGGMLGGQSAAGGMLGQIGGLLGGAAGLGLGSALGLGGAAGLGGLFGAGGIMASIFGSGASVTSATMGGTGLAGMLGLSTAMTASVVLAPLAGALLIGGWLLGRNKRRREEEKVRNQAMLDSLPALQDLLTQVKTDKIDGTEAISRAEEIRQTYVKEMSQLKDKKTRNIALKDVSRLDTVIEQIKVAAKNQSVRRELDERIVPTYATGGVGSGLIRVSQGESLFLPHSEGSFGGHHIAAGGIPNFASGGTYTGVRIRGNFDGKDNILARVPKGTVIANPRQVSKIRQSRGYAGGGVAGGRIGTSTAQGTITVQPPPVTAIIVFSPEEAERLGQQIPNAVIVGKVRQHVKATGPNGLAGDVVNTFR